MFYNKTKLVVLGQVSGLTYITYHFTHRRLNQFGLGWVVKKLNTISLGWITLLSYPTQPNKDPYRKGSEV